MYLENTYTNNTNIVNENTIWLIKKKGTSWGINNNILTYMITMSKWQQFVKKNKKLLVVYYRVII